MNVKKNTTIPSPTAPSTTASARPCSVAGVMNPSVLKADPLAGMVLHRKLLEQQFADNVMLMDPDRLAAFGQFVRDKGRGDDLDAILLGDHSADVFAFDASMPVASDNPFFYEDMSHPPTARVQPIASFADSLGEGVAQPPEK